MSLFLWPLIWPLILGVRPCGEPDLPRRGRDHRRVPRHDEQLRCWTESLSGLSIDLSNLICLNLCPPPSYPQPCTTYTLRPVQLYSQPSHLIYLRTSLLISLLSLILHLTWPLLPRWGPAPSRRTRSTTARRTSWRRTGSPTISVPRNKVGFSLLLFPSSSSPPLLKSSQLSFPFLTSPHHRRVLQVLMKDLGKHIADGAMKHFSVVGPAQVRPLRVQEEQE